MVTYQAEIRFQIPHRLPLISRMSYLSLVGCLVRVVWTLIQAVFDPQFGRWTFMGGSHRFCGLLIRRPSPSFSVHPFTTKADLEKVLEIFRSLRPSYLEML